MSARSVLVGLCLASALAACGAGSAPGAPSQAQPDPNPVANTDSQADPNPVTNTDSQPDPICGLGMCLPEAAPCKDTCQCCTGLCSASGLCEFPGPVGYAVGDRFTIRLPGTAGTGYEWLPASPLPACVSQVGDPVSVCVSSGFLVGCAQTTTFTFEAAAPGEGTLRFEYRQPWVTEVPPLETYEMAVSVQ